MQQDLFFMRRALAQAAKARRISPPNPSVGCVIVRDGVILGEGHTQATGSDHAEVQAVKNALAQGHSLEGATVYVTLEPCSHYGRTPPCSLRLIQEKVARVVIACRDPNPLVAGRGMRMLTDAGIVVEQGLLQEEAWHSMAGFMTRMTQARPWVRLKVAMSLDGQTALANGESQWITGAEARNDGHRYRAEASAIVTGIGTVLADDPQLTVRVDQALAPRQPLKVVLDSQFRIDPQAKIFDVGSVLVVGAVADEAKIAALQARGAQTLCLPDESGQRVDLNALLVELGKREINEVHLEAGARLNGAFLDAGLVDEIVAYVAPKILGQGRGAFAISPLSVLADAQQFQLLSTEPIGADVKIVLLKR